jgi:hypothetical protein
MRCVVPRSAATAHRRPHPVRVHRSPPRPRIPRPRAGPRRRRTAHRPHRLRGTGTRPQGSGSPRRLRLSPDAARHPATRTVGCRRGGPPDHRSMDRTVRRARPRRQLLSRTDARHGLRRPGPQRRARARCQACPSRQRSAASTIATCGPWNPSIRRPSPPPYAGCRRRAPSSARRRSEPIQTRRSARHLRDTAPRGRRADRGFSLGWLAASRRRGSSRTLVSEHADHQRQDRQR